jgi:hypothetical protein
MPGFLQESPTKKDARRRRVSSKAMRGGEIVYGFRHFDAMKEVGDPLTGVSVSRGEEMLRSV